MFLLLFPLLECLSTELYDRTVEQVVLTKQSSKCPASGEMKGGSCVGGDRSDHFVWRLYSSWRKKPPCVLTRGRSPLIDTAGANQVEWSTYEVCLGGSITRKILTHPVGNHVVGSYDPVFTQRMQDVSGSKGDGQEVWAVTPSGTVRRTVSAWYSGGDCQASPGKPYVAQVVHYCSGEDPHHRDDDGDRGPFSVEKFSAGSDVSAFLDSWSQSLDALVGGKTKGGEYSCQFQIYVAVDALCDLPRLRESSHAALRYQRLIASLYAKQTGYGHAATRGRHETYGELTTEGFLSMLEHLPVNHRINKRSVLFDLGSGVGKFVFRAAMMSQVSAAIGIEIVEKRHGIAQTVLEKAEATALLTTEERRKVRFETGDALDVQRYATLATHLYAANLCFNEEMNRRLAQGLSAMGKQFQCIMVLVKLPVESPCLQLIRSRPVRMSWSHSKVYYYCNRCS